MSNPEFTDLPHISNNTITENTKITKAEKLIIVILLVVLSLLVMAVFRILAPTPNNVIIVNGLNPNVFFFHSTQYAFSIDQSKVISSDLPKNLGNDQEWSPDGQWIVSSIEDKIYIMRAGSSQQILVPTPYVGIHLPTPTGAFHPTWSPDGKRIAYYERGVDGGIYVSNNVECLLRGESCTPEFRILIHHNNNGFDIFPYPDWSPDGRQILYHDIFTNLVYTIATDGQNPPIAISDKMTQDGGYSPPRWSPDGTKILGTCLYDSMPNICVMNRDGSNLTYLTKDTNFTGIHYARWSPDGKKIAYISYSSKEQIPGVWEGATIYPSGIFIVNADGSGITHLPFKNSFIVKWFTWIP